VTTPSPRTAAGSIGSLLELDPDLGMLLDADRRAAARRDLRVRFVTFPVGEWDGSRLAEADPAHYGLLLVEGVLARELVLSGLVSTELLGSGDLIRPWRLDDTADLLPTEQRWNVLSSVRLALLDRRTAAQLGSYPEIGAVLVERMAARTWRLSVLRSIGQLTRVEERLTALFWHLAERWGRMTAGGVAVPLALPHRLIGELIGARRPTVSTVLGELSERGVILRREDGTWLLTEPAPAAAPDAVELVCQRRRLLPEPPAERHPEPRLVRAGDARATELRAALAAAQEASAQSRRDLETLRQELTTLTRRTAQLRNDRRASRGHGGDHMRGV
jgi:CRP/FNR family cyclic AMP-dependent transcriptional regulator